MSICSQFSFGTKPITCHAYNGDQTQLALSLNDENVLIFKKNGTKWEKTAVLSEHSGKVTGLDWAPQSNQIVSCGADRNAFVWKCENGQWKPELVLIRINRAAICVKWSPKENKFACGTGSRLITVCHYDDENNWWVSKNIKKPIRSSVISITWHPNNYLLAAGTTDCKCRVFSAYIKGLESKPGPNEWGTRLPFGELLAEYGSLNSGWVHGVSFNEDGTMLGWVSHNSSVGFARGGDQTAQITSTRFLPFSDCMWTSRNTFVGVGFDCNPIVFNLGPNGFEFADKCDQQQQGGVIKSSMNMWQQMDTKGTTSGTTDLKTKHKNSILEVKPCNSGFSTCGADGQIIQWSWSSLSQKLANLRI